MIIIVKPADKPARILSKYQEKRTQERIAIVFKTPLTKAKLFKKLAKLKFIH